MLTILNMILGNNNNPIFVILDCLILLSIKLYLNKKEKDFFDDIKDKEQIIHLEEIQIPE